MQPVQFLALLQRHNTRVTGNTYVMADLQPASPAGEPSVPTNTTTSEHTRV